ncbi:MAG TPA: peptidase, partial [Chloroflexota bacterium]|nr:peptidase [Chloroflexota bacterium]
MRLPLFAIALLFGAACTLGDSPREVESEATRVGVGAPAAAAPATATPPAPTVLPQPAATAVPPTAVPSTPTPINLPVPAGAGEDQADQRTIAGLRARVYEGGEIEIVRTLADTATYTSYLIAYPSDGLRVTGFLNVPKGEGPFPVLIINHGFVPPQGYVAVASNYAKREGDFLATRGYLTAGSDFRGHGNS